jgi:predicted RNA-binding protein YlqC (UPF0109 family)
VSEEQPVPVEQGLTVEGASSLLVYLTRALVRTGQDQVTVRHTPVVGDELKMSVQVPAGELGKVVGKGGRTANAIRTVVGAFAQRGKLSTQIEFTDGRPGGRGRRGPRREDRGGRRSS